MSASVTSGLPLLPCTAWGDATDYPGLSTIFTPPDICFTRFTIYANVTGTDQVINSAIQDNLDPSWLSCLPTEYDTSSCRGLTFSPALCPSGYTMSSTSTNNGITTGTCCMSGFSIVGSTAEYIICIKSTINIQVTRRGGADASSSTEYIVSLESGNVEHRGWVVMWKSSELAEMTTTGSRASASSTREASKTETSNSNSSGDGGAKGLHLSGGAIAGIVLGVLAALALGVMAGILWGRRGKKKQEDQKGTPIMQVYNNEGETHGATYELRTEEPAHELSGR